MHDIYVGLRTQISMADMAEELRDQLSHEEAIQFILDLDERFADLGFTTELYARLGDALREELESDAG